MTTDHSRQSQFELFPQSSKNSQESIRSVAILKDLTLSQENIIVSCIVLLMVCIVFYSFGVESGKRVLGVVPEGDLVADAQEEEIIILTESVDVSRQLQPVTEIVEEEIIDIQQEIIESPAETEDILKDFYTVQVASFKFEKNARKEVEILKKSDYESFVVPKGNYSIVCVGKFIQRERAKVISRKLKKKYNDLLVRRL